MHSEIAFLDSGCLKMRTPKPPTNQKYDDKRIDEIELTTNLKLVNREAYVNLNSLLLWTCGSCEQNFERRMGVVSNAVGEVRCLKCVKLTKKKTNKKLDIQDAREAGNKKGITLLSKEYINIETPMKWRCRLPCMNIFDSTLNNVSKPNRLSLCPTCTGTEEIGRDRCMAVAKKRGGSYLTEVYTNKRVKNLWLCAKGHEFSATPDHVCRTKDWTWCKECKNSKLEEMIAVLLEEMGLEYISQETFFGCLSLKCKPLRSDAYVFRLVLWLEGDGGQHFDPVKRFGDLEAFENQVWKDGRKAAYCMEHGISLIRVSDKEDSCKVLKERIERVMRGEKFVMIPIIDERYRKLIKEAAFGNHEKEGFYEFVPITEEYQKLMKEAASGVH